MVKVYGRCIGGPPILLATTGELESRLEGLSLEWVGPGSQERQTNEAPGMAVKVERTNT